MVQSEYDSMVLLEAVIPDNIPKAVACGICASNPSRAFFLAEWRDMRQELPPTDELVALVHKMHQAVSPTGKFGCPSPRFAGNVPYPTGMFDSWEEHYAHWMKKTQQMELSLRGPDPELEELVASFLAV